MGPRPARVPEVNGTKSQTLGHWCCFLRVDQLVGFGTRGFGPMKSTVAKGDESWILIQGQRGENLQLTVYDQLDPGCGK